MDKGEGEKTKRKRTFTVLGKMLAISGHLAWLGREREKYAENQRIQQLVDFLLYLAVGTFQLKFYAFY